MVMTLPIDPRIQTYVEEERAQRQILYEENTRLREQLAEREEEIEDLRTRLQWEREASTEYEHQLEARDFKERRRQDYLHTAKLGKLSNRVIAVAALEMLERKASDPTQPTPVKVWELAGEAGVSPDVTGTTLKRLSEMGVLNYEVRPGLTEEGEPCNDAYLSTTALSNTPSRIKGTEVQPGGARKKGCSICGSLNVDNYTIQYCRDCQKAHIYGQVGLRDDHNIMDMLHALPISEHDMQKVQKQLAFDGDLPPNEGNDVQNAQNLAEATCFWASETPVGSNLPSIDIPKNDGKLHQEPSISLEESVSTCLLITEIVEPPDELRKLRIWCCHRAKVPYSPRGRSQQKADVSNSATWGTYSQALQMYEASHQQHWKEPFDGIGLMCDGSFTVIDHDHCIDIEQGCVSVATWERITRIASYSEVSPSCTGVHQIAFGTVPAGRKLPDVEMYSERRFLTWTGNHITGTPDTIEHQQEQIAVLYEQVFPKKEQPRVPDIPRAGTAILACTDEEIIKKASTAKNGAKFQKLWNGDAGDYLKRDGNPDQSSADQALCNILAYWTDASVSTIDRLFRQSGLYRQKWEREDYRQRTLDEAIRIWALRREVAS